MIYSLYLIKRQIEDVLMYPFILLGRMIAKLHPLNKEYDTFFFFPFYHIGGAEKVHAQIAKATGNKNCIIYFTKKSGNNLFWKEFEASGCELKDISKYTDNKWLYVVNIIFRGILSGYINKQKKRPLIFNGQCNFGYKISPWIHANLPQVELIHSLCSFSYIRIPFLPFITKTVMISTVRIQEHINLYRRYNIPYKYDSKIDFIMNGIDLPPQKIYKGLNETITVLYVGRSTAEKRVHLIAEIAQKVQAENNNIQFQFLGDVKDAIPSQLHHYCYFWGNQSNPQIIEDAYKKAHILILVSDTEGFPMVVMEAMAHGLAIVTTAVGEIPLHVGNNKNGFLIFDFKNSRIVVEEAKHSILKLTNSRELFKTISETNTDYAFEHFGMERFTKQYQNLFAGLRSATT